MKVSKTRPIAEPIARLQQQLDEFRRTGSPRTRLPESVWQTAAELARQYGVYAVAHPLRLDMARLKQRLAGEPKPEFVELVAPPAAARAECVVELEFAGGGRMRIEWKAAGNRCPS